MRKLIPVAVVAGLTTDFPGSQLNSLACSSPACAAVGMQTTPDGSVVALALRTAAG